MNNAVPTRPDSSAKIVILVILPIILSLFFTIYQLFIGKYTLSNYLLAGIILSFIPMSLSLLIFEKLSKQKKLQPPAWYVKLIQKIPQPYLFFITLFLAIVVAPASIPISNLPYGLIFAFALHLALIFYWMYQRQSVWWQKPTRIIYYLLAIGSLILMLFPALKVIFIGSE